MPYLKLAKPFSLTTILAYKKIVFKYLSVRNHTNCDKGNIALINKYKCTLINEHKVRFNCSTRVLYSFAFKKS